MGTSFAAQSEPKHRGWRIDLGARSRSMRARAPVGGWPTPFHPSGPGSSAEAWPDHYFANACDENGNLGEDWRARSDAHHKRVQDANEAKRAERIANDQGSAADEVHAADEGRTA